MSLSEITTPQEKNLLIAFCDLTHFVSFSRKKPPQDLFLFLATFAEKVGDLVESAGGTVIKFIGDAALIAYNEDSVDAGVENLLLLKAQIDGWLKSQNIISQLCVKAHFGLVICGPLGTKKRKSIDVIGETVNITATLTSNGFSITPQVFRKLSSETRKHFKKHTPPIRYIPVTEHHKD